MSPSVSVDQNALVDGSETTRLPLKKTWTLSDQRAGLVVLASQRGSLEAAWRTARASWFELTRRKPREKFPLESLRRGWNDEIEGFGFVEKPLRSS